MNAPAYAIEPGYSTQGAGIPERALWLSALALLLDDARRYHRTGKDHTGAVIGADRRALRDVLECGPMLTRLCDYADVSPQWVSERFRRSIQVESIEIIEQKTSEGISEGAGHL